MRRVESKLQIEIEREWDRIATVRHEQILSGKDTSYHSILLPCINMLAKCADFSKVLDVGCGSGLLLHYLERKPLSYTGLDLSAKSIELAEAFHSDRQNALFIHDNINCSGRFLGLQQYTLILANMFLMDCLDLKAALATIKSLMSPDGTFIATITHPCFWPNYWGYNDEMWFSYSEENIIEAEFKIAAESTDSVTTHIHRPLARYVKELVDAGFYIDVIDEPRPVTSGNLESYTPRFLAFKCSIV